MSMWIISRGVVLLITFEVGISFKFGISGLLHQVITTIADRIRDKDTSQSKQNLQSSSMTFIHKTLIILSVLDSCFNSFTVCEVKRIQAGVQVSRQGVSKDIFSSGSALEDFICVVFVPDRNIEVGGEKNLDVKTIVSFFAPIGNCVRKWATNEFVKDNDEINHEVFKSDNENDLGVHDNEEEEIAFLDGLLEDENFFEINDKKVESLERKTKEDFETKVEPKSKKELQVVHPDIEILNHFETTSYVGSDYVFYEDFNLVDMLFPMNIQGKIFDPGITFHEKPFEKDAFKDKSSKELAPSKALLTLDVFDPLHPPLMDFHVTKAFSGFSGFWKIHGSILWKDKAMPTISIDDLQSSLHKEWHYKDKSEQNQSKPTRNGKDKTRVQNESRISPIQVNEDPNESQRINADKFTKLKGSFG
ncbi:hypothetical protein Tco_0299279 [Tanacetum coccineum]